MCEGSRGRHGCGGCDRPGLFQREFSRLNFGGNCEEAFRFYEKHLGGEITMMLRQSDLPAHIEAPGGSDDAVIHARMNISGVELIGNDVPPNEFKPVRSSYLYLAVDSASAADETCSLLAEGGEIGIPISETFFASRFAQLRDRFGTLWTIIHQEFE